MTDFVLVHGAWHGSWCWKKVRELLAAQGHRVFTPTLTGLGERSHLLSRDVSLETHVADVINLVQWEEIEDFVLVGHSYGGLIVRHVADRVPRRIRCLVYLDCFVPDDGQSLNDCQPEFAPVFREQAATYGDGWKMPPVPAVALALNEADMAWVDRQCTAHPLVTFETPARLCGACDSLNNIGYVMAAAFPGNLFGPTYERAGQRGWWQETLACGHDVMLDMPQELASLLVAHA